MKINKVLNFDGFDKLLNEDEDQKKSGYRDLYLIYINKIIECYGIFRQCVPANLPADVKKRKPELINIIKEFDDLSNAKKTYSIVGKDSGKGSHNEMWDSFERNCKDLKNKVREFYQIYAALPDEPERGESETRSELEDRIKTGGVDARSAILYANTEAAEYANAAAKIYTGGAKSVLDDMNDSDVKKASAIISDITERNLKTIEINEGLRKSEKRYVENYKEVSYLSVANTYISIYQDILNIREAYKNQKFYSKIESKIENYIKKTGVDSAYDFFVKIGDDPKELQKEENRKKIEELADKAHQILRKDGDLSLYKFKSEIEEEVGGKYAANEILDSGDSKLNKARALIRNLIELSIAKEKAAERNLDKLVDRLSASAEPKKDRVAGEGITVISANGELTEKGREKIKEKIKTLLGDNDPDLGDDGQGRSVADLAYKLSFYSGNDYRDKDGKIDVDKLYKDLDVFTKDVVGNKSFNKFILNF